jgi:hypothetical protein
VWYQSQQLLSTQCESPIAPKPNVNHVLNCEQNFSFFIFRSELSDIQINCNWISKGLLYTWKWV